MLERLCFTISFCFAIGSVGCTTSTAPTIDCTQSATSTGTRQLDAAGCPIFDTGGSCGLVTNAEIFEASGLAASRKTLNVLWTHNDKGDAARLMAISTSGQFLGSYFLGNVSATDWEDLAIGPGPANDESYLYVGDIGDNDKVRANVQVYRVPEPQVDTSGGTSATTLGGVETFTFVYPDGPHNAETLFVDPLSGDIFIVGKADSGKSPVFRAAAPLSSANPITLELATTLVFGSGSLAGNTTTTGGDMLPDGGGIAIRTYDSVYFWQRKQGVSIAEALAFKPCPLPLQTEEHGETFAFAANNQGYFTLSEGTSQPLYFYAWK